MSAAQSRIVSRKGRSYRRSLMVARSAGIISVQRLAAAWECDNKRAPSTGANILKKAKVAKKRVKRREWTKADLKELKAHSKARTPVVKIAKITKRTIGA